MTGGTGTDGDGVQQGLDQAFLALVRDRLRAAMRVRAMVDVRLLRSVVAGVDNAGAPPEHRPDPRTAAPSPGVGLGAMEVRRLDLGVHELEAVLAGIQREHQDMVSTLEALDDNPAGAAADDRRAVELIHELGDSLQQLVADRGQGSRPA